MKQQFYLAIKQQQNKSKTTLEKASETNIYYRIENIM